MHMITTIKLTRAQTLVAFAGQTATVTSWKQASIVLSAWALTIDPKDRDSVDFVVTWEDEHEYRGEIEITYKDAEKEDLLAAHVRSFARRGAGLEAPPAYTLERWKASLSGMGMDPKRWEAFLNAHEIGDVRRTWRIAFTYYEQRGTRRRKIERVKCHEAISPTHARALAEGMYGHLDQMTIVLITLET